MRKLLLLGVLYPIVAVSQQRVHVTLFGGISNYTGDLQEKKFTLQQSNLAFGAGLMFNVTPKFAIRAGINRAVIEGDDKRNSGDLRPRNLSFTSKVIEGTFLLEYTFLNMEDKKVSPFINGGIAMFRFNPYAYDTLGTKIYLQPLGTEGQGLAQYPGRQFYKLQQIAIPASLGVKFRIGANTILSYEVSVRKTFTDYLDDVSTTYVDQFVLANNRGLESVNMAYRGDELKDGVLTYPGDGTPRGGADQQDWYYYTGFTLYIGLGGGGNGGGFGRGVRGGKGRLGCPNVL
jgi:hypothetical protein